ncbi:MAG: putative beta-lysine N-acetyltransferase [Syntrophotaleaceae bacterium]
MPDVIETLGQSRIQHGIYNDRIYLMKLSRKDLPELLPRLERLARNRNYSKIFAKVPESSKMRFAREGYVAEASIPNFYQGREAVVFFGKYLQEDRRREKKKDLVKKVLATAKAKAGKSKGLQLPGSFRARATRSKDVEAMAEVYRQVFATYPFPIWDPSYLKKTMEENVAYFGIWEGGKLVALSSAEMDLAGQNAEMTDFATLPEYRGQGLANYLLAEMEDFLGEKGVKTAYTIARAYSYGMNITFAKLDYEYSGTLTNNTNIFGGLESMNVWHKPLEPAD